MIEARDIELIVEPADQSEALDFGLERNFVEITNASVDEI